MRGKPPAVLEQGRITTGDYGSDASFGMNGAFQVRLPQSSGWLMIIASDGLLGPNADPLSSWEHVSVSLKNRTPRWEEMSYVKALFWEPEECVVQFHPPQSEYVNIHPNCLHLWRSLHIAFPQPPHMLVGPKDTKKAKFYLGALKGND